MSDLDILFPVPDGRRNADDMGMPGMRNPPPPAALPPHQLGWLCPACGRGNSPSTSTCPCKGWPKMEVTC